MTMGGEPVQALWTLTRLDGRELCFTQDPVKPGSGKITGVLSGVYVLLATLAVPREDGFRPIPVLMRFTGGRPGFSPACSSQGYLNLGGTSAIEGAKVDELCKKKN